jgi:hypothetical protein
VQPDEVFQGALARSRELGRAPQPDQALERLRTDCVRFFDRVPEPPVYPRMDDPARARAADLVREGQELLARCLAVAREEAVAHAAQPFADAMRAHLAALVHTVNGRLREAEEAWAQAGELERHAVRARRLWERSDESPPPVYDRQTGVSRYDPAPDPLVKVKLACPNAGCQKIEDYAFSPRHATHQFLCPRCKTPFIGYFAEARQVGVTRVGTHLRHYVFRLEEAGGGLSRVEFDESSGTDFTVARQDLLAFLYTMDRELRAVLDLTSSKLLWVRRGGPCFVATVAFGEGAPELATFRAYRDRVLWRSRPGAWAVRAYYRVGPGLAAVVKAVPPLRAVARRALGGLHQRLWRRGFR